MDLLQTWDDVEALGYPEVDMWTEYEEDIEAIEEEEEEEGVEVEGKEEEKEAEVESEIIETDVLASYMTKFEARRAKELAVKAEEEKKQLQQLIEMDDASLSGALTKLREAPRKKDVGESEETLVTPEDEVPASDRISTESSIHPCLREIDISDSRLKLVNPYTVYPVPDDPGLQPALWLLYERPPVYEGARKFDEAVKRLDLRPIKSLRDMLVTDELNLRYYGLESRVMRAICEVLADNTFVRRMDLKDNKLSTEACRHLNELLVKNNVITDLSLSGCRIGSIGAKKLCGAISKNATLKTLDLSKCDIENEGLEYIASALCNNQSIESVNLTDNHLDEKCSENLRDLLLSNETLTHLNLSWNSLYSVKTWKALIDGLDKNETLLFLNLSWNALGAECVPYLCQLLSRSPNLQNLNLSWNRFTEDDAILVAKALSKNSMLQELYLGNNPLKMQGALTLVRAITPRLSPDSALRLLDLENVWAKKDIIQELETIKTLKPWVVVKLGGILSNYRLVGPDARRILLKRANYEAMMPKRKRQRRNFGHFVMSLKDEIIPRARFMELVQEFKLKLSTSLIDAIMNVFEGPKNTVDQQLLKSFYLEEYPATTAAPARKKGKKEKR